MIFDIDIPIYDLILVVSTDKEYVETSWEEWYTKYPQMTKEVEGGSLKYKIPDLYSRGTLGWCISRKGLGVILIPGFDSTDPEDMSTLVHELLHFTHDMFDYKGMVLTDASAEAYTYFIGWLVKEVLTKIKS